MESNDSEDNNEGAEEDADGRDKQEILLLERRHRMVTGGQEIQAPRTGAGGDDEVGRVHIR